MSFVTNAILIHSVAEQPVPGSTEDDEQWLLLAQLNEVLRGMGIGWFTHVRSEFGGCKRLECVIHVAALNGADAVDRLAATLRSLPWRDVASVQLFLKPQDDARFVEVDLRLK